MYCCCGPTTLPGRTIRMKPIASFAVNPYFHTRYAPMSVPVRPSPALHLEDCSSSGPYDERVVTHMNSHHTAGFNHTICSINECSYDLVRWVRAIVEVKFHMINTPVQKHVPII